MDRPQALTEQELHHELAGLSAWSLVDSKLHRELEFADFSVAFGFMAAVATVAERLGHHPDWSNSYNRVVIDLSTHDVGSITSLDVSLAGTISNLAERFTAG